mmetsp:Transcript_26239/g.53322  ORF Transcript_26239/g.53322 Transcript_26239/m.53322 type:complete len:170 (+) Transcript_26239:127-636(+)
MAQIAMLTGQACLGVLVMAVSLLKLLPASLPLPLLCPSRHCRKLLHNALLSTATCSLGCCASIAGALHDGAVAAHRAPTRSCPALPRSPRTLQIALGAIWVAVDLVRALPTSPSVPALVVAGVAMAVQGALLATEFALFYMEYSKQSNRRLGEGRLLDGAVEMVQSKAA